MRVPKSGDVIEALDIIFDVTVYVAMINQYNPEPESKTTIQITSVVVGSLSILGKLYLEEKDTIYNIHVEGL